MATPVTAPMVGKILNLVVANGAVNVMESLRGQPRPFRMRNQLFHNDGTGRFEERSAAGGPCEIARPARFGTMAVARFSLSSPLTPAWNGSNPILF